MNDIPRRPNARSTNGLALLLLVLTTGCAGVRLSPPQSPASDVAPNREDRKEAVAQDFGERRVEAEFRAALSRWNQGDATGCETLLRQILKRRPHNHEARQLLADLYVERGDTEAALAELSALLDILPDSAQAHHAMGLLLDSLDRHQEAVVHLRKAAEFEPGNDLYKSCLDATLAGAAPPEPTP